MYFKRRHDLPLMRPGCLVAWADHARATTGGRFARASGWGGGRRVWVGRVWWFRWVAWSSFSNHSVKRGQPRLSAKLRVCMQQRTVSTRCTPSSPPPPHLTPLPTRHHQHGTTTTPVARRRKPKPCARNSPPWYVLLLPSQAMILPSITPPHPTHPPTQSH